MGPDGLSDGGCSTSFMVLNSGMLAPLVRFVRILHMTIGISEPTPAEERAIALLWVVLFVLLVSVFVVGLFVIG
jgi:hypothetical protein